MRHLHDVSRKEHSGSRILARHLNEQRRKIADALAVDCGMPSGSSSLQIMLRTLVSSLAEAIEAGDPEVVLHWARLTRTAHSSETILEAVAAACAHAGFAAERFHVDSGTLLVFVEITLDHKSGNMFDQFRREVQKIPEVLECHLVSGDFDYLIKARIGEMADYRKLLGDILLQLPGAVQSKSYVVMEEIKETLTIAVGD